MFSKLFLFFGCSFETFADIDVKRMNIRNTVKFVTAVFVLLVCLWPDLCFSITKMQKKHQIYAFRGLAFSVC